MSKTLVCVNVLDNVRSEVYGSHCQEWFRLGRKTEDEFILFHPARFSIDNARNQAASLALQLECDYIYFIDDDMILSPETYQSLKACDADIAQALTFIRGMPFDVMAFKYKQGGPGITRLEYFNDYKEYIDENGLVACAAVGFACVLLKVETLKKIDAPYFITGAQCTEDVYYCVKLLQKLEGKVKIVIDTKVPTGHLLHSEILSVATRDRLTEYYGPGEMKPKDRGKDYLEQCKQLFPQPAQLDLI